MNILEPIKDKERGIKADNSTSQMNSSFIVDANNTKKEQEKNE